MFSCILYALLLHFFPSPFFFYLNLISYHFFTFHCISLNNNFDIIWYENVRLYQVRCTQNSYKKRLNNISYLLSYSLSTPTFCLSYNALTFLLSSFLFLPPYLILFISLFHHSICSIFIIASHHIISKNFFFIHSYSYFTSSLTSCFNFIIVSSYIRLFHFRSVYRNRLCTYAHTCRKYGGEHLSVLWFSFF